MTSASILSIDHKPQCSARTGRLVFL